MSFLLIILCLVLAYLAAATVYLVVLALASLLLPEAPSSDPAEYRRFAILIPAHNEELLISRLLVSLLALDYPTDFRKIFVVADNCTDDTATLASRYPITVVTRTDQSRLGKGFAIRHALQNIDLESFDALLVIDADNTVDRTLLLELNRSLNRGEQAIQCHNAVANRHDSWFTELLYVSRTIGNRLYHQGKYKLGLSSYLMGNGICLSVGLLKDMGWNAFSLGEDWEYSALIAEKRIKVGFAVSAKVFHQESRSLDQATSQRLRWAKGRFEVGRRLGLKLLFKGIHRKDWVMADASLPFIFPNYSLQVNLTILTLVSAFFVNGPASRTLVVVNLILFACQLALFFAGMILAGQFFRSFIAVLCAPAFLLWKCAIDLLSITGLYGGEKWIRTRRHSPVT